VSAYEEGQKARGNGKCISSNPHYSPDGNVTRRNQQPYSEWKSGWEQVNTAAKESEGGSKS